MSMQGIKHKMPEELMQVFMQSVRCCPILIRPGMCRHVAFQQISTWHKISSLAQTLGSWVRIPLEVWMSVRVYSAFVLSSAGSGLATGLITW
jgi:hypothetical protein